MKNLTEKEKAAIEAMRAEEAQEKALEAHHERVDKFVALTAQRALRLNEQIRRFKEQTHKEIAKLITQKDALTKSKAGRRTDCFTNQQKTQRVTCGYNVKDYYLDTVEDGILQVKNYISSLAKSPDEETLVKMVLDLLAKDREGQLSAKNVLKLEQYARKSGDIEFCAGVNMIKEAYSPIRTKDYIRVEVTDEKGVWKTVPLNVTDC